MQKAPGLATRHLPTGAVHAADMLSADADYCAGDEPDGVHLVANLTEVHATEIRTDAHAAPPPRKRFLSGNT